jgi:hypothetical protein
LDNKGKSHRSRRKLRKKVDEKVKKKSEEKDGYPSLL